MLHSLTSHTLCRVWSHCNHWLVATAETCCDQWDLHPLSWSSSYIMFSWCQHLLTKRYCLIIAFLSDVQRTRPFPSLQRVWLARLCVSYIHFVIEHLRLLAGGGGQEVRLQQLQQVHTNSFQLSLNFCSVTPHQLPLPGLAFNLLLHTTDTAPCCTPGIDHILVPHWKQVSLLHCQFCVEHSHMLHGLHHLCRGGGGNLPSWIQHAHMRYRSTDQPLPSYRSACSANFAW